MFWNASFWWLRVSEIDLFCLCCHQIKWALPPVIWVSCELLICFRYLWADKCAPVIVCAVSFQSLDPWHSIVIDHPGRMLRWLIDFFSDLAALSVCGRPVKWWIQWLSVICPPPHPHPTPLCFVCGQAGAVKDYIKMMLEAEQLKFLVFGHHLTMLQACTEAAIEAKVTVGKSARKRAVTAPWFGKYQIPRLLMPPTNIKCHRSTKTRNPGSPNLGKTGRMVDL